MKSRARTTGSRARSIAMPRRTGRGCLPNGKVLSHDWTEADILALALWLKEGGPADRREKYRHEVGLQLLAIEFARESRSQQATNPPIPAALFGST